MTVTNNYSLVLPTVGGDTNLWGGLLNNGVITVLDTVLGGNLAVSMTSSNVALTASQFQNAVFTITGTLTNNLNLTIPLSPNSATVACAGHIIVNNQTTGAFNITVLTVASGSTGVTVPQGVRSYLYSDGTNVYYSDDENRSSVVSVSGTPQGSVAGTAGAVNTVASLRLDRASGILYVCTTTGTTSTAVWGGIAAATVTPQGYLTLNSNTTTVITTTNTAAATTVYYSPLVGNLMPISNGSFFTVIPFSQLSLTLSSSQAANNIYDVFAFLDSGTLRIGTGPSWSAGSGSITAGSCARGTGAGSTQLSRSNGLFVNTNAMSAINGATTYAVAAGQGTFLGSVYIDGSAGQITCNRTWGQSRKWGVSNAYNRQLVVLRAGDSTASWTYGSTWRPSRNDTANSMTVFDCLGQETQNFEFEQGNNFQGQGKIGVGYNSTSSPSGTYPSIGSFGSNAGALYRAVYAGASPALGINVVTCLEAQDSGVCTFQGTEANMALIGKWLA